MKHAKEILVMSLILYGGFASAGPALDGVANVQRSGKPFLLKDTAASIGWDLTVAATGQLEYGLTAQYGQLSPENSLRYFHTFELTGLQAGSTYHYRLKGKDLHGKEYVSPDHTFTTLTRAEVEARIKAARKNQDLPKTYYVATGGSDSNDGLTKETAWQRPSHAAKMAEAGDTIHLIAGTWHGETVDFANSGIDVAPITLVASDGTPQLIASGNSGVAFNIVSKQHIHIQGPLLVKKYGHAVYIHKSSYCRVSGVETEGAGGVAIHMPYHNHYNVVDRCTVRNNGWNGIMIFGREGECTHNTISNCTVENADHNGIDVHTNAKYNVVIGNKVSGSRNACGIYVHQTGVEWNTVANNTVHDNACWGINFPSSSNNIAVGNTSYNHKLSGITVHSERGDWCAQAKNNILLNNRIYNVRQGPGINICGAEGTLLIGNIVEDSVQNAAHYFIERFAGYDSSNTVIRDPPPGKVNIGNRGGEVVVEFTDGREFTATKGTRDPSGKKVVLGSDGHHQTVTSSPPRSGGGAR